MSPIDQVKERLYGIQPIGRAVRAMHEAKLKRIIGAISRHEPAFDGNGAADPEAVMDDFLRVLDACEGALFSAKRIDQRRGIADYAAQLNERAASWLARLPEAERQRQSVRAQGGDAMFLNRSLLACKPAIAFSHNFSPALDPAALVCTKRLREISRAFDGGLSWHVISQDMSGQRTDDASFDAFFGRFQYSRRTVLDSATLNTERDSITWGERAFQLVADEGYGMCYSHCWHAGSHVAARLYKRRHPDTIWIAEFGDPVFLDTSGQPRQPTERFSGDDSRLETFWGAIERAVFDEADVIVFNNANQRDLMLGPEGSCAGNSALAERARQKSCIMPNCRIDERFSRIMPTDIGLDERRINVAYAGSIYPERPIEPLYALLENPEVELHLFLCMAWTDIPNLDQLPSDLQSRVRLHEPLTHLETLNVCAQMDYCAVVDLQFPKTPNPYQPSKYFDYLSVGSHVIAYTQPGSAIDTDDNDRVTCAHTTEEMRKIARGLSKRTAGSPAIVS